MSTQAVAVPRRPFRGPQTATNALRSLAVGAAKHRYLGVTPRADDDAPGAVAASTRTQPAEGGQ